MKNFKIASIALMSSLLLAGCSSGNPTPSVVGGDYFYLTFNNQKTSAEYDYSDIERQRWPALMFGDCVLKNHKIDDITLEASVEGVTFETFNFGDNDPKCVYYYVHTTNVGQFTINAKIGDLYCSNTLTCKILPPDYLTFDCFIPNNQKFSYDSVKPGFLGFPEVRYNITVTRKDDAFMMTSELRGSAKEQPVKYFEMIGGKYVRYNYQDETWVLDDTSKEISNYQIYRELFGGLCPDERTRNNTYLEKEKTTYQFGFQTNYDILKIKYDFREDRSRTITYYYHSSDQFKLCFRSDEHIGSSLDYQYELSTIEKNVEIFPFENPHGYR